MHADNLKGNMVGTGVLMTSTVLLLGVLSLAYGYFQGSGSAFAAGLAVIAVGMVSGILQVVVLPKGRGGCFPAQ